MTRKISFALTQRMRFIDSMLFHYGHINRRVMADYFGMSTIQAAVDFIYYKQMAPENMVYDLHAKKYMRSERFKRIYL